MYYTLHSKDQDLPTLFPQNYAVYFFNFLGTKSANPGFWSVEHSTNMLHCRHEGEWSRADSDFGVKDNDKVY